MIMVPTASCVSRCKAHVYEQKAHAPYKQVAVDREELTHILQPQRFLYIHIFEQLAVVYQQQYDAQKQARVLSRKYRPRYTLETQSHLNGKQKAEDQIGNIDRDIRRHGAYGILHSYEESFEYEQRECCRRRPYPDEVILAGIVGNLRRTLYEAEGYVYVQILYGKYYKSYGKSRSYTLGKHLHHSVQVSPSKGLGYHAPGSNPQEAHVPVQQVKQHGGDSHAAYCHRIPYMAGNANVNHCHQRNGDVGQYAWYGQLEHLAVNMS